MSQFGPDFLQTSLDDVDQPQRSLLFTSLDPSEFDHFQPGNDFAALVQVGPHGQAERELPYNQETDQEAARSADHYALIYTVKEVKTALDKFISAGGTDWALRFIIEFKLTVEDAARFYNFVHSLHRQEALEGEFYELRVSDLLTYLLYEPHNLFKTQVQNFDPTLLLHDDAVKREAEQLYINCLPLDKLNQAGLDLDYHSVHVTVKDLAERDARQLKEFERQRQFYEAGPAVADSEPVLAIATSGLSGEDNFTPVRAIRPPVFGPGKLVAVAALALLVIIFGWLLFSGLAQLIAVVAGFVVMAGAALAYFLLRTSLPAANLSPELPANAPVAPPQSPGRNFRLLVEEGLTPGSQVLSLPGPGVVITAGIRERNSAILYFWNENAPEQVWDFPGLDAASLEGLSQVHAHFRLVDGAIHLCSGSPDGRQDAPNGTFINGERLGHGPDKGRPVKPNDLIGLGPRASGVNKAYNRAGGVTLSFEPL